MTIVFESFSTLEKFPLLPLTQMPLCNFAIEFWEKWSWWVFDKFIDSKTGSFR